MARIINKPLLESYREKDCEAVNLKTPCLGRIVAHHLRTVAAGGDDIEEILLALCVKHHREIHDIGTTKFVQNYWIGEKMIAKGWEYDSWREKWIYPIK